MKSSAIPSAMAPPGRPSRPSPGSAGGGPAPGAKVELSVVVPLYNEAGNVEPLYRETSSVLSRLVRRHELILVDDGSRDDTFAIAKRLAASDPRLRVVRLRRNYGQSAAVQAGIDQAAGAVIVVMDGDLQNDPNDIEKLLAAIDSGYDAVSGWRKRRVGNLLTRRLPSRLANLAICWLTGVEIHDNGCALKAYRREVLTHVRLFAGLHRFILPVVAMSGCSYGEIVVDDRPRRAGRSKYGLSRTWKVALDLARIKLITSFATRPALFFGTLGLPPLVLALASLAAAAVQYSVADDMHRFPLVYTSAAILFAFAAMHLLLMALITELVVAVGDYRQHAIILRQRTADAETDR